MPHFDKNSALKTAGLKTTALVKTLVCTIALGTFSGAGAQQAQDRAGDLKLWREKCSEPDVDLRIGHIEMALETQDMSVIRICTKKALESTDADIRNLGLRTVIANLTHLTFKPEMPVELANAYKKAGSNEKDLKTINGYYITRLYRHIETVLTFEIEGGTVSSAQSTWYPLGGISERSDSYKGTAAIIGDEINWAGEAHLGTRYTCRLSVKLDSGPALAGHLHCNDYWKIPVRAPLL